MKFGKKFPEMITSMTKQQQADFKAWRDAQPKETKDLLGCANRLFRASKEATALMEDVARLKLDDEDIRVIVPGDISDKDLALIMSNVPTDEDLENFQMFKRLRGTRPKAVDPDDTIDEV
jgi:hypothetical protein